MAKAGRKSLGKRQALTVRISERLLSRIRETAQATGVSANALITETLEDRMGHNCGSTCKRKTGERCETCRRGGAGGNARRKHATPQQIGLAVDVYYKGLSYRESGAILADHYGRPTSQASILRWTRDMTAKAKDGMSAPVKTGDEWVADEMQVRVGGKKYWLFNVMDSRTRYVLAAYLTPYRTARSAATVMAMARERAQNPPKRIKTDGLKSYQSGIASAFCNDPVQHVVSQGIRAQINNNMSERLLWTFRDRDKTLRGLKSRESGQRYIDGLVLDHNYFRPHGGLDGKRPAEAAASTPKYRNWREVAEATPQN